MATKIHENYLWFLCILLVSDGFFIQIFAFLKLFLVLKKVMCMLEKRVKMCEFCGYIVAFKIIFSIKRGYESIFRFVSILF